MSITTTSTATSTPPRAGAGRPTARSVARLLARPWATHLGWFWLTMAVIWIAGTLVVQAVSGEITTSVWVWILDGPKYYLLAIGIGLTSSLPMFVANGVTRRDTVVGMQAFIVGACLVSAIMTALYFGIEALVYDQLGWGTEIVTDHLFTSGTQSLVVVGESFLLYLGWMMTGHLVSLGYKRWGGWLGTVALPLTLAPGLAVQIAMNVGSTTGPRFGWADDVPLAISIALAVVAIVMASAAAFAVVRNLAIRVARG